MSAFDARTETRLLVTAATAVGHRRILLDLLEPLIAELEPLRDQLPPAVRALLLCRAWIDHVNAEISRENTDAV